jgi:hypothetical protein
MDNLSIKGIFLGSLATILLGNIFSGFVLLFIMSLNYSNPEINSNITLVCGLIFGALAFFIGGYICATISKKSAYLNSGMVALGVTVVGMKIIPYESNPLLFNIVCYIVVLTAALLGGHITTNKKDALD